MANPLDSLNDLGRMKFYKTLYRHQPSSLSMHGTSTGVLASKRENERGRQRVFSDSIESGGGERGCQRQGKVVIVMTGHGYSVTECAQLHEKSVLCRE